MFFHAALLFDNEGFSQEAVPLARAVEQDDLVPLYQQALDIAAKYTPATFFLGDYGVPLALPDPIEQVRISRFRNSEIGNWFMLVTATYHFGVGS